MKCDPFLQGVHKLVRKLRLRAQVSIKERLPAGPGIHTCWGKVPADLGSSGKRGFWGQLSSGTLRTQLKHAAFLEYSHIRQFLNFLIFDLFEAGFNHMPPNP